MYKDSQGDVWDKKTIKQLKTTEANQIDHDIYHNKKKISGILTIDNYQNETVENVGGCEVPIGSWRKNYMVSDTRVIELIKNNLINGVSINNTLHQTPICANELKNIEGNIFYNSDIENKECMKPIFDSFVKDPANGYGMNVYSYDKFLEKSKVHGGNKLTNKLKEMFKSFGESIMNLANEMEDTEQKEEEIEETEVEEQKEEMVKENEIEEVADNNDLESEVAELRKSVEKQSKQIKEQSNQITELLKSDSVVKEEDSIDDRRNEIRDAIIEKYYPDNEDSYDIWINLMAEDCVIIENYDENKYYKVDYNISDDKNINIGDLVEVELQYAVKGETEESDEDVEETSEEEEVTTAPESQKSKQPKIKGLKEKLETVEMEKESSKEKVNRFGMPIRSTKELAQARNQFNF